MHEAMKRAFSSAQDYGAGNVRSCAEGYSWWRHNAQAPQQARVCVERLLALTPRWSCIGKGCEECVYAAACDASSTLDDTFGAAPLLARPLVVVLSAPGETFRLRREHSARQLEAMGIGAILATTVTRDMLEPDGFLDMCTAAPQTEVGAIGHKALSTTYFASALNHLHTYVHALRLGFGQLIVLEDDMTMALGEGSTAVAASVMLRALSDSEHFGADLAFFGTCAGIGPNISTDSIVSSPAQGFHLWQVSQGSRCAGAYSISTRGIAKALLHLPMWCSMDWMLNGAKHAPRDAPREAHEGVRTTVLFLEPALFQEGSKLDPRFATTMTGCEYCPV